MKLNINKLIAVSAILNIGLKNSHVSLAQGSRLKTKTGHHLGFINGLSGNQEGN